MGSAAGKESSENQFVWRLMAKRYINIKVLDCVDFTLIEMM